MMPQDLAVYPAPGIPLGFGSWVREIAAGAWERLKAPPSFQDESPMGDGHPVLIIPGFCSSDLAVLHLKRYLAGKAYRPVLAGLLFNPGPMPFLMRRLERKFLDVSAGERISLIGISLGGVLARDLARRYPERVRSVVTLCSPVRFPVTSPLAPFAWATAPFHAPDWVARRHDIARPLPMPVTALHAQSDGVVLREECWLEPSEGARNVIVEGRHMTVECTPKALAAVASALASIC